MTGLSQRPVRGRLRVRKLGLSAAVSTSLNILNDQYTRLTMGSIPEMESFSYDAVPIIDWTSMPREESWVFRSRGSLSDRSDEFLLFVGRSLSKAKLHPSGHARHPLFGLAACPVQAIDLYNAGTIRSNDPP